MRSFGSSTKLTVSDGINQSYIIDFGVTMSITVSVLACLYLPLARFIKSLRSFSFSLS
jgi:hypothetical protein